ncbi:MAG TPA: amino acid adenylation domain-containing protein [Aquabacterium sp.]|uniref:non-ribosomal peptide synthetase n=1 Tax=Aquabacterium sp. TaxID=1872578 RepID=UPI002E3489EE|nr:non-ribosomal peptide synthetase [Aquabacterium sp.]HEX5356498.1 amino acid adenylation domain-containing protein [Aquabacterium sp.]
MGRQDHQIKVRGFRIEPGEIEARLLAQPGVQEAAVLAVKAGSDQRLVAYVAGRDTALLPEALRGALQRELPDYMVPAQILVLDALPLNASGKVDRKALPEAPPAHLAPAVDGAWAAPQGAVEEALAAVWSELLNVPCVNRQSSFFDLGGHSLLIVQMVERLRAHGYTVSVRDVLNSGSLAELALSVSAHSKAESADSHECSRVPAGCTHVTPDMVPLAALTQGELDAIVSGVAGGAANVQDIYPLAPLQEGLLFHRLMGQGHPDEAAAQDDAYVLPMIFSVATRAQLDAFLRALQGVIDRHDILRTAFVWEGLGRPMQVVWRRASLPLAFVGKLAHDYALPPVEVLKRHVQGLGPLPLDQAPLGRVTVLQPDATDAFAPWCVAVEMHHLVCDHVSQDIILGEIKAILEGHLEALPAPVPYRGFVRHALQQREQASAQEYFRSRLGDVDEPTLPLGLVDVLGDGRDVAEHRASLSSELASSVRHFAREHGVSVAAVFHAAWALVVGQCSGRDDVVFGSVLSGRLQGSEGTRGADRALGLFINTLPLRMRLHEHETTVDLVRCAQRELMALVQHEHAPLADAQRCSSLPFGTPMFSAVLNYRHTSSAMLAPQLAGVELLYSQERSNYPFALCVDDLGEGFMLSMQTAASPERIVAYLQTALRLLVADRPLTALSILPEAEWAQLRRFNDSHAELPSVDGVHRLFEAQVARTPEGVALQFEGTQLTYAQLDARADWMARVLVAQGVRKGQILALLLERGPDAIVAKLAALKAGAAYLAIDPHYPPARILYMLGDAQPAKVLSERALAHLLGAGADADAPWRDGVLLLDERFGPPSASAAPDEVLHTQIDLPLCGGDDLAYVVYTSGSTGQPKGVMVTHGGLCNLAEVQRHVLRAGPGSRVLQFASYGFDACAWEWLMALTSGATLHLARRDDVMPGAPLQQVLKREGITHVTLPPVALAALDDQDGLEQLRTLVVAGEVCPPPLMRQWAKGRRFFNAYGPSEASVCATMHECAALVGADGQMMPVPGQADDGSQALVPIGRPIANTQIWVLDAAMRPAPIGVAGEIYIGGAGLARGYLHRAALTDERFVADPFQSDRQARLYRSGDLGRWRPDGVLAYLGRVDQQIKLRGYRIELGEVEAQLVSFPGVQDSAVVLGKDRLGESQLCGFVTLRAGVTGVGQTQLRAYLQRLLPDYMVPAALHILGALPLSPNGKIDRKALAALTVTSDSGEAPRHEPPRHGTEAALAAIWAEVLGVEAPSRDAHFFHLGGHSLRAVQLATRMRSQLGRTLPLRDIFDAPVLSDMAARLDQLALRHEGGIPQADRSGALALSWAQHRMWFLDRFPGAAAAYVLPMALHLQGALDLPALEASLRELVLRHEALRTRFPTVNGQPCQVIDTVAPLRLEVEELGPEVTALPDAELAQALLPLTADMQSPFDLASGPLLRARVLRQRADAHILLVTLHHIVADGWSLGVLTRDLCASYAARVQDPSVLSAATVLPALTVQYADFAQWQRATLTDEALAPQLAYWRSTLAGAPDLLDLPTDRPRTSTASHTGETCALTINAATTAGLRALAQHCDATLYMVLLSAWAMLLSRLGGQDEVVIGSPVANRQHPDLEDIVGFFVNTLAMRVRLEPGMSAKDVIAHVREVSLGAFAHQDAPFERVVDAVSPVRSLSHSPVFQATLTLQNAPAAEVRLPGITLSPMRVDRLGSPFELNLTLSESGDTLVGAVEYASDLFERRTIQRWMGSFEVLLQALSSPESHSAADGAHTTWRHLPWIPQAQLQQLARFNPTPDDLPAVCLDILFEQQVDRAPHATALVFEGQHISYAELDARANHLAHGLHDLGVGRNDIVAILCDRGPDLIVSVLGVLKAGAAYLPLDPSYPVARLAYMVNDAAPRSVVTQAGLLSVLTRIAPPQGTPVLLVDMPEQTSHVNPLRLSGLPLDDTPRSTDDLAYLIYTSGSTGEPKGVMVAHRGLHNLAQASTVALGLNRSSRVLQFASFSFDASAWEWIMALTSGASLHLASREALLPGPALRSTLVEHGITHVLLSPSALAASPLGDAAHTLETLIVGGEACQEAVVAPYAMHCRVINAYGPTEASVCVTLHHHIHKAPPTEGAGGSNADQSGSLPIGKPLPNTAVHILDTELRPVPIGVTGELYIGGTGLARGYLGRPDLSAARFIPDPVAANQRLYKTGDLGRWREDGSIDYKGRNDHQVKVRGFRIELGEIEARLMACAGVRQAVVLARQDAGSPARLVAYVATASGEDQATPSASMLRAALKADLPDYMVPGAIVVMAELPQTPNGKVDRDALPEPEGHTGLDTVTAPFDAPRTPAELALADIWAELLGISRISRQDSFFDLGGHSLLIMQMIDRLSERGMTLGVSAVFRSAVLADLALAIEQQADQHTDRREGDHVRGATGAIPVGTTHITPDMLPLLTLTQAQIDRLAGEVTGGAANIQDIYPLTPLQEGILFHHELSVHGGDAYVLPVALRMKDDATRDRFLRALQAVVDRHDALRTAMAWHDLPQPVQIVWRQAPLTVDTLTLSDPTECGYSEEAQLRALMAPEHLNMSLQTAPLLRVQLVRRAGAGAADGTPYVLLQLHHIVCDHISLELVLAEVAALMQGAAGTLAPPVPYRDFVAYTLANSHEKEAEAFFKARFSDVDDCTAPFGLMDVHGDGGQFDESQCALDASLSRQIRAQAQKHGVSPAAVFHLAWALVLARCSGRSDVVFGTVMSGRLHATQGIKGMQQILGMFVNTLPVRVRMDAEDVDSGSLPQALVRMHQELLDLVEFEQTPLTQAQRCSGVPAGAPLFTAMLNYRHSALPNEGEAGGMSWHGIELVASQERSNFPVSLSVDDTGQGFMLSAEVAHPHSARRLNAYMLAAVASLVQSLEAHSKKDNAKAGPSLAELNILPDDERSLLLHEFSQFNANAAIGQDGLVLVHEQIAAHALRRPHAVALAFQDQQISYRELDERVARLAALLRQRGVAPDQLVAVCLPRGLDQVITLLAVLRAGGAFLPLDPTYPVDRLSQMLTQAYPGQIVTNTDVMASTAELFTGHTSVTEERGTPSWQILLWDALPDDQPGTRPEPLVMPTCGPSNLAYVIFTSGSTGVPKGVMIEHRNLAAYVRAAAARYGLHEDDRVLQFSSVSFDAAVEEIFVPLSLGATVVLRDEEMLASPRHFMAACARLRITVLGLPTAYWRVLASATDEELDLHAHPVPPWRLLVIGGEAASAHALQRWQDRFASHARLFNSYGPTETTVVATVAEVPARLGDTASGTVSVSIGTPLSGTHVLILGPDMRPAPMGAQGEIYIGGAQVGRGYLNQTELTADRFVADPFHVGERLYRTGDIGRWLPDGQLQHLGRNDDQVKLRGFRVELGEVESRMAQLQGVRDVAVVMRADARGEGLLVAYVVLHEEAPAPDLLDALRAELSARLPDYMVPKAIVALPALPLSPNGKVHRRALPAPDQDAFAHAAYEAPITARELSLAEIWSALLNRARIGRQDHFFELGGHSLLVMQMIERLRQAGWHVPLRRVFDSPRLCDLAAHLQEQASQSAFTPPPCRIPADATEIMPEMLDLVALTPAQIERIALTVPGGAGHIQDIYPLAPLQEGIYFHHLYAGDSGDGYILPTVLRLDTPSRVDELLAAMHKLIQRHDILRTAVVQEGSDSARAVQVVWRQASLPVQHLGVALSSDKALRRVHDLIDAPLHMDMQQAPLLRVAVSPTEEGHCFMAILVHHLVSDHVSQAIMLEELQALIGGLEAQLPAPVPYRHFVAHALSQQRDHDARAFFTGRLSDVDDTTAPFGLQDVRGDMGHPLEHRDTLTATLALRLRTQGRRLGVSPAALVHAAWSLVVSRATGQHDVVLGSIVSGRMQGLAGADRVIGMFINTLPVRIRLQGLGAEQLVRHVQAELMALLPHEQTPLTLAQGCSGVPGGLPLFTSVLNYRHSASPDGSPAWPGIELLTSRERTNFPLALSVDDLGAGFALTAQTMHGPMDEPTVAPERVVAYMAQALESLVRALEQAPDRLAETLPVLPPAERQALTAPPATQPDSPRHRMSIVALFKAQCTAHPDGLAIVHHSDTCTYAELDRRSSQLARHLQALGLEKGQAVAIIMARSIQMVAGELAVLKAGGWYVPIDADAPAERQAFILQDCGARIVIVDKQVTLGTDAGALTIVDAQRDAAAILSHIDDDMEIPSSADDIAYAMYTSGSTGRPKGVIVPHRGVTRVAVDNGYAEIDACDVVAHCSNPAFDASTFEIWGALLNGACLAVVDSDTVLQPDAFARTLTAHRVSVMFMTTALFCLYADALSAVFKNLRHLLFGGESLDPGAARRVLRHSAPTHLLHVYGPTETTTFATAYEIKAIDEQARSIPIGHAIAATQVYVLDGAMQLAPTGVTGEIYIGGAGVALGYLNQPELTQASFVADPFKAHGAGMLYRTGDLGCWRAPGVLEYVGRNDQQIKIRGFRIEPGEIEAQLAGLDEVKDAVVLAREDHPGDKRLVAYITSTVEGLTLDTAALRDTLAGILPDYMIPSALVQLPALPLTPNGKVDRKALPAPHWPDEAGATHEAPRPGLEQSLAAIWSALLHHTVSRRDAHFFHIGGHSLLAVQLVSRIREQLHLSMTLKQVFDAPVLSAQAALLGTLTPVALPPDASACPLTQQLARPAKASREGLVPLSLAQQRLWFLDQMGDAAEAYVIPLALKLDGALDIDALRSAFDAVIERHEILRTSFPHVDGVPSQHVHPASGFELLVIDQESDLAGDQPADVTQQCRTLLTAPFDLARGPLLRGMLIRQAPQVHELFMAMHHIVSDGWSMNVLVQEVVALYAAFSEGHASPLPPLPIQYADYAIWQRQALKGAHLANQAAYWQGVLRHAPALLTLPLDHPRPLVQTGSGARVAVALDHELTAALRDCADRHGVTLHMLLLSAWAILLSRLSGQDEAVIGTPVANRPHTELEGLIGFFVNTLPLRVHVDADASVQAMLEAVRANTLAAYAHQDLPFDQIVEAVAPPRSLSHAPVFQVLFSLNNAPADGASLPGLQVSALDIPAQSTQFDLALALQESKSAILGAVDYAVDLFDQATVERWMSHWTVLLQGLADASAQTPVSALPWMLAADRHQVLHAFNQTQLDELHGGSCDELAHELFEEQVRLRPEAIALRFDGLSITYAELDARARQVAGMLQAQGIGPDQIVGVLLDRGIDMVVAVLACLKAGGAYLPLDPGYPEARLRYMVTDARPGVILTDARLQQLGREIGGTSAVLDIASIDSSHTWARPTDLNPGHLAYVIYTSGSTGEPKGVMLTHGGLVNLAHWQQPTFGAGPGSQVLQFSSFSFDACTWEWSMALCHGATLCMAHRSDLMPGPALWRTLHQLRITHATLPPVALSAMSGMLGDASLPDLHTLVVAGEACSVQLVAQWAKGRKFFNAYGPTEITVCATAHLCDPGQASAPPIGRPMANARVYVLDAHGHPTPTGVPGEIYIGGAGVARGYLNKADLSASRFLADPFCAGDAGARMYRTGDLGRWQADGTLVFLGRCDHQVKVHGLRIELGEIESMLLSQHQVRDAVVLTQGAAGEEQSLTAYLALHAPDLDAPGQQALIEDCRMRLRARLPAYMVPGAFVVLPQLPLTPNGKVDRQALAEQGKAIAPARQHEYAAPVGDLERALCALWQEVLNAPAPVGRHDNFFDMGGHSLAAARLMSRVQALGLALPLSTIFAHPTPAALAEAALSGQRVRSGDEAQARLSVLRRQGEQAPLFIVHDISGTALPYVALSSALDVDRPIYGLLPPATLMQGSAISVTELAGYHVDTIREKQAQGPYYLAGWSAGGVLAHAMAAHLVRSGQDVAFLGLIDAPYPGEAGWQADSESPSQADHGLPSDLRIDDVQALLKPAQALIAAVEAHVPEPVPLAFHYFAASHTVDTEPCHLRGWQRLADQKVQVHNVNGDHWSIMRSQALPELAVAMSLAIRQALSASSVSPAPSAQEVSSLVVIQAGQAGVTPVVCVPGAGANVTCFVPLALALGAHVPVYGLQPRGLDGVLAPHPSVEAAAASHVRALSALCEQGPFKLLGHSFGGWIAFEMARQLQARKAPVSELILLDSTAPSARGPRHRHMDRVGALSELADLLAQQAERPLNLPAAALPHMTEDDQMRHLHQAMAEVGLISLNTPVQNIAGLFRVFAENLNTAYQPASGVDVPVLVARAHEKGSSDAHPRDASAWREWAPIRSALEVPGNHMTLLARPHIDVVARALGHGTPGCMPPPSHQAAEVSPHEASE